MGRGAEPLGPAAQARIKKKAEEEEILFFSPETLKLKVDIPKNYVEDDRDFYEAKTTARLVHQGKARKDPLRLRISPDRQQSLEYCTFDHDLREHEEMKTNSSISFEVRVRVWKTDLVTINAHIAGTPPGGAVPAHRFLPGQSLTRTMEIKLMATATGRDPFVTLDALLDIEIDITAKKRPAATAAAYKHPPRRPYITNDDDDGLQFQFKQPPCKKCKERPVDGADGLCSVCRNEEDRGNNDPPKTLVEVPDVIGKTRFHARNTVSSAGLTPADSSRTKKESQYLRGTETLHNGETVVEQKPEARKMVPRSTTVTLDYAFDGEIVDATEEDNGHLGRLVHKDEEGRPHREDGPSDVELMRKTNGRWSYEERWNLHGKAGRIDKDLPSVIYYDPDGSVTEQWYEDDQLHRADGPAAVVRKGDKILEANFWVVRNGKSVLHNEEGPAVSKNYPGQDREEIYFLDGEEMSREEWERKREATTTLDGRIEEHLMKEEAESS